MTKPATAGNGIPRSSSRGAAVKRAKAILGDAIDARLELESVAVELREMEVLAEAIGCNADEARAKLDGATLDELERWTAAVIGDVKPNAAPSLFEKVA